MGNSTLPKLWYLINNVDEIPSPALIVYPERIKINTRRMIKMAGNANRLRPHVKTHKMAEIIRLQMQEGINKFKCATIAEAEMVAGCGVEDILLAIQPVGPNLERFFKLKEKFPDTNISCIVDSEEVVVNLSDMAAEKKIMTNVWLDINNGMNRTGIIPGEDAVNLMLKINGMPWLKAEGLHVYDGHIHESDISKRIEICNEAFVPVIDLIDKLKDAGMTKLNIVAGGSPTFPVHAMRQDIQCSPGTILLWDYGYESLFPDMDFLHAALLLTRVISKPAKNIVCLDLGYKSVAAEMPQPRLKILGLSNYEIINQSEEHLVIRTTEADKLKPGQPLLGVPRHICPTVARYDKAFIAEGNRVTGQWEVVARKRKITI